MHIVHFIGGLEAKAGGPSRSVPNQCISTVGDGFDVTLAYLDTGWALSPAVADARSRGVIVRPYSSVAMVTTLAELFRTADVVHIHGIWPKSCFVASLIARYLSRPIVISPHGTLEPWAIAHKQWKKKLGLAFGYRRMIDTADVIQSTSKLEASSVRKFGVKGPVAIISNGIEFPEYEGSRIDVVNERVLLFLSRIHSQKGTFELMRAIAKNRSKIEAGQWRVVFAGPDTDGHWSELDAESKKLGVEDLVTYVGPVDGEAKWELFRSASLFAMPSFGENFGLVIAEALACGVPCLTTRSAPWEELETERCGWWHPATQEGVDRALDAALSTPRFELMEMGNRGMRLVKERYSVGAQTTALRGLYQWMKEGGPRPNCVIP